MIAELCRQLIHGPATLAELARWMQVPRRTVEQTVQEARLAGVAIISDGNGVHLAADATEAAACDAALRRRAITQLLTARAMRRAAKRMAQEEAQIEQPSLWDAA